MIYIKLAHSFEANTFQKKKKKKQSSPCLRKLFASKLETQQPQPFVKRPKALCVSLAETDVASEYSRSWQGRAPGR